MRNSLLFYLSCFFCVAVGCVPSAKNGVPSEQEVFQQAVVDAKNGDVDAAAQKIVRCDLSGWFASGAVETFSMTEQGFQDASSDERRENTSECMAISILIKAVARKRLAMRDDPAITKSELGVLIDDLKELAAEMDGEGKLEAYRVMGRIVDKMINKSE